MNLDLATERQRQLELRVNARSGKGSLWLNPVAILLLLGAGLGALLFHFGAQSQIFTVASLASGWLMAYYSANWNSRQNAIVQLKQKACGDVVKKAAATERDISGYVGTLAALISRTELSMDPVTGPHMPLKIDADKLLAEWQQFSGNYLEMLYAYSESEILLMPLEAFRVAVYEEHNKLEESHSKFTSVLFKCIFNLKLDPNSKKAKEELLSEIQKIREFLLDQASYLHDFRIELLNYGLGEFLDCSIPRRQPLDPRHTTLNILANQYRKKAV